MLCQSSFQDKNILVLGFGKSGQSATNLLANIAKNIFVFNENLKVKICQKTSIICKNKNKSILKKIIKNNQNKLKNNQNKINLIKNNLFLSNYYNFKKQLFCKKQKHFANILLDNQSQITCQNYPKNNVFLSDNLDEILQKNHFHFCVVSPGVSVFSDLVNKVRAHKICVLSELELGAIFCRGKIFAITGTNGKTTTCHALFHVFKTAQKHCFLCGNVGTPITQIASQTTKNSLVVCEVSSFQMETTKNFRPYAAALLNVMPDHLDRHKTLARYAREKTKLFDYWGTKKVFNIDDYQTAKIAKKYFCKQKYSIKNKKILKNNLNLIKNNNLIGKFNFSNLACVATLARLAKIPLKQIQVAIQTFVGLPHRLVRVGAWQNVQFVNDSKSTNIASTLVALSAMRGKVVLMLGGAEKNLNFLPLAKANIFAVVAFGEVRKKLAKAFFAHNNFCVAANFEDAFWRATELAKRQTENVTVLLSPATSSFDEFCSYQERGVAFECLVKEFCEQNLKTMP